MIITAIILAASLFHIFMALVATRKSNRYEAKPEKRTAAQGIGIFLMFLIAWPVFWFWLAIYKIRNYEGEALTKIFAPSAIEHKKDVKKSRDLIDEARTYYALALGEEDDSDLRKAFEQMTNMRLSEARRLDPEHFLSGYASSRYSGSFYSNPVKEWKARIEKEVQANA